VDPRELKRTRTNLLARQPYPCHLVGDAADVKGYQFKGTARFETSVRSHFDAGVALVKQMMPGVMPKAVLIVNVKAIFGTTTPCPDARERVSCAPGE
jgi:predicted pyridoxine 5'-phosphate oxidase superfamily flavin-nucleotide-binding protein